MTTNIYILRLTEGKWYIGKSENVIARYQQHLKGNGACWTKKYTPISLEKTIENASHFDEDKVTKEYMAKYGIQNVRGGSYCAFDLDDYQIEALNREIWGAQNKCVRCGRSGHFEKSCYATTDVDGNEFVSDDEDEELEFTSPKFYNPLYGLTIINKSIQKQKVVQSSSKATSCYRCGREGHWVSDCYANTDVDGNYIR